MADMILTNQALPQGQPNDFEEIKKYLTTITDEIATADVLTSYMTPNPTLFQAAKEAGVFSVPTITTSGLGDYDKAKGSPLGAVSTEFTDYRLRYDRARSFILDGVDMMQNGGLLRGTAILAEFMREQVVPEIDLTRISTCADTSITAGNTKEVTPAKASFLSEIISAVNQTRKNLKLRGTSGMKIHVNDKYQDVLELSSEYTRTKGIDSGIRKLDTGVDMINQAEIIWTPEEYMYSKFEYHKAVTSAEPATAADVPKGGTAPAENAKEIAVMVVAPGVANGLVASETSQIFAPGTVPGIINSTWIDYRVFHDCLIMKNKVGGIYTLTVPSA